MRADWANRPTSFGDALTWLVWALPFSLLNLIILGAGITFIKGVLPLSDLLKDGCLFSIALTLAGTQAVEILMHRHDLPRPSYVVGNWSLCLYILWAMLGATLYALAALGSLGVIIPAPPVETVVWMSAIYLFTACPLALLHHLLARSVATEGN